MQIKKTLVNIIALFILAPKPRRAFKRAINNFSVAEIYQYIKFNRGNVRPNSILLAELNDCHGEVMAGILPYFQQMGYNIDILMNDITYRENPFCRHNMRGIRVYRPRFRMMQKFIASKCMQQYDKIFVMTSAYYHRNDPGTPYGAVFTMFHAAGLRPYVMEHDLVDIARFGEDEYIASGRMMTLGKFDRGIFVNAHDFGDIKITPQNKTTTFITVGSIEAGRKNFHMLIDAISDLADTGREFRVIVVGNGKMEQIPRHLRKYIKITGRLAFPKMFRYLEYADFFLTLLDENNPAHERYITTGVTGSAQLVYGFAKIPVIHQKCADFYRFDNTNAIVYNGKLSDAMAAAIDMNTAEYAMRQNALQQTAAAITNESAKNLQGIIDAK